MIRVFAALFPSEAAREHLVLALRPIREQTPQEIRWTDPDNWHLTLAFYGDQPNDAAAVRDHLAHVSVFYGPLDLHLAGAGAFEHRTLWAGVGGQTAALKDLMAECHLPDPAGSGSAPLRNRAHLTIGRTGRRMRDPYLLGDVVHALAVYKGPSFIGDEICLVQSFLGEGRSGGPKYEVLERYPLR